MGQGYGKTYNSIARSGLSVNAKVVYMVLAGYADKNRACYPTRKTLICDCGFCEESFDKGMKELIKAGVVTRERGERSKGKFQSTIYTLHDAG